ncbi:MAG: tetratricopeptide repeat protein [Duganella sp.]
MSDGRQQRERQCAPVAAMMLSALACAAPPSLAQAGGGGVARVANVANVPDAARPCLEGGKRVSGEAARSWSHISQAAKRGDPQAAYCLGMMYRDGVGVQRDSFEAARWLQVAANAQLPAAMFALANLHLSGDGVRRDDQAARYLIEKAADLEYPDAVMAMAIGLRDGSMGFERNEALAETQMRLANRALRKRNAGM